MHLRDGAKEVDLQSESLALFTRVINKQRVVHIKFNLRIDSA